MLEVNAGEYDPQNLFSKGKNQEPLLSTKPGSCLQNVITCTVMKDFNRCKHDSDCLKAQKCCDDACGKICMDLESGENWGTDSDPESTEKGECKGRIPGGQERAPREERVSGEILRRLSISCSHLLPPISEFLLSCR